MASVQLSPSDQLAADILTTAVESGYSWFQFDGIERAEDLSITLVEVTEVEWLDGFTPTPVGSSPGNISLGEIKRAMRAISTGDVTYATERLERQCRDALRDPTDADFDAADADGILQVAMFGEVVYG